MTPRTVTMRPSVSPAFGKKPSLVTATIRAAPAGLVHVELPIGVVTASAVVTCHEAAALGVALIAAADEAEKAEKERGAQR
jgi:hypothetical protein